MFINSAVHLLSSEIMNPEIVANDQFLLRLFKSFVFSNQNQLKSIFDIFCKHLYRDNKKNFDKILILKRSPHFF